MEGDKQDLLNKTPFAGLPREEDFAENAAHPFMKPQTPLIFLLFVALAAGFGACASSPAPAVKTNASAPTPATAPVAAKPAPAAPPAAAVKASPAVAATPAAPVAATPAAAVATTVDFQKQIQPIFAEYCYKCHGLGKQSGGVRLDVRANLIKNVTPGDPSKSNIYRAITRSMGASDHMPPVSQDQPEDEDIALIKQWILQGAAVPEGT